MSPTLTNLGKSLCAMKHTKPAPRSEKQECKNEINHSKVDIGRIRGFTPRKLKENVILI